MYLYELLKIVPEGQWVLLSITTTDEVYGFYYRSGMEQVPTEYYNNIVHLVHASKNNALEVCI